MSNFGKLTRDGFLGNLRIGGKPIIDKNGNIFANSVTTTTFTSTNPIVGVWAGEIGAGIPANQQFFADGNFLGHDAPDIGMIVPPIVPTPALVTVQTGIWEQTGPLTYSLVATNVVNSFIVNTTVTAPIVVLTGTNDTINVAATTNYPTEGTLLMTTTNGVNLIHYTGLTATTFTGCSGGSGSTITGTDIGLLGPAPTVPAVRLKQVRAITLSPDYATMTDVNTISFHLLTDVTLTGPPIVTFPPLLGNWTKLSL